MPGPLDTLLPPSKQYHYQRVFYQASFYSGIIPDDPNFKKPFYKIYKRFTIVFLFSLCLRTVVECFIEKDHPFFLWVGDFKIWWGKPYLAHQVVFLAAVFIVPVYSCINLNFVCPKDHHWTLPFHYVEGLKTGRQIKIEDKNQLDSLYKKMKANFYRSYVLMYSVNISYMISVFASYYMFYETNLQVFTLGIFWTIYETLWSSYITENMGIYPACLEIITFYCILRYNKAKYKLNQIRLKLDAKILKHRNVYVKLQPILVELCDLNMNLLRYNHYWRKITMTIFTSYVPQALFELYVAMFFNIGTSVLIFGITLVINMALLMGQLCAFSATVIGKAYSMKRYLNDIYIRMSQECRKSTTQQKTEWNTVRQLIKLSTFLEQYNYKHLGIYLFDFCILDWNFFCSLIINFTLYFLLIADIIH